jgi:hypothetical protein
MGKLVEELLDYISKASNAQLDKDWEELKDFNDVGPTVTEYFNFIQKFSHSNDPLNEIKISNTNPEFSLDFLLLK